MIRTILLTLIILSCSGCLVTTAMWENTLEDSHTKIRWMDLTREEFNAYRDMAETSENVYIDPDTGTVYIKDPSDSRTSDIVLAIVMTPFTLLMDVPILMVQSAFEVDEEDDHPF